MENDTKKFIIAIFAVGIFIGSIIGGIYVYSGVSPPFTVINSGSMQHSDESSIGTIDTGDMVIVKNPDYQEITTYVEGSKTDYSKFGEYGDVIIYRSGDRNIIHRAMLHMTLYETGIVTQKWYIPELKDYDDWDIVNLGSSKKSEYWDNENCILTVDVISEFCLTDVGMMTVNRRLTYTNWDGERNRVIQDILQKEIMPKQTKRSIRTQVSILNL